MPGLSEVPEGQYGPVRCLRSAAMSLLSTGKNEEFGQRTGEILDRFRLFNGQELIMFM